MALTVSQVQDYMVALTSDAEIHAAAGRLLAEITGDSGDVISAVYAAGVFEGLIMGLSLIADVATVDMVKRQHATYVKG